MEDTWIKISKDNKPEDMKFDYLLWSKLYGAFAGYIDQIGEYHSVRYMQKISYNDITHFKKIDQTPPKD